MRDFKYCKGGGQVTDRRRWQSANIMKSPIGDVGSERVNHASWLAVVTQTGHSMSIRNRSVINVFVKFYVVTCLFYIFRWYTVGSVKRYIEPFSFVASTFYLKLVRTHLNASRRLKLSYSLSIHLLPRINVMLVFI